MDKFKDIIRNKTSFEGFQSSSDANIWNNLSQQIDELEGRKRRTLWMYTYAAAASVVIGIMIALLMLPSKDKTVVVVQARSDSKQDTIQKRQVTGPITQKDVIATSKVKIASGSVSNNVAQSFAKQKGYTNLRTKHTDYFELPDHSVVALDKEAQLFHNDSYSTRRAVMLEGQGYFEVRHDPVHPFTVYFGNTHLIVLGTKFYIKSLPSEAVQTVAVVEGSVKVYDPHESTYIVLTKGQELVLRQNAKSTLSSQISENTVLWKKGTLLFDKTKLKKVFYALNKEHDAKIKYHAKISNCIFTGNLSGMSLSDALNLIKLTTNLVAEEDNDQIFITGTKCD